MSLTPETVKTLDDQVREIARHLEMEFDEEYAAERQEHRWSYHAEIKSDNKRISFATSDYRPELALKNCDRWIIRAVFPKDKRGQIQTGGYNVKTPEITVAMDRGAEKIARAIETRLLPEYEKQLTIALERIEKSDAYHEARLQTIKTVAEYFGQPVPEDDDRAIYPGPGWGVYKIEAVGNGEIKFYISAPMAKAISIFEILRG